MKNFESIAIEKIKQKCSELNYVFNGFVGGKYINAHTKLDLSCNVCGNNWTTCSYDNFIRQSKCPNCMLNQTRIKENVVIANIEQRCKEENLEFLGFKNGKYLNNLSKINLKCNKCGHEWTTTYKNLVLSKTSCPISKASKLEKSTKQMLQETNIDFIEQCHFDFLGKMTLDFFIPSKNIAIECQGKQHFIPTNFGDNNHDAIQTKYLKQIERDELKFQECERHGIQIIYFADKNYNSKHYIYTNVNDIKNKITEN